MEIMYKAYIFDLDGTLLDTISDLCTAVNYAFDKFGYPNKDTKEVAAALGSGFTYLIRTLSPENCKDDKTVNQVVEVFSEYYKAHATVKTLPYEGTIEVLKEYNRLGKRCLIVSNKKDFMVKELVKKFFDGLVEYAQGEDEEHGIGKKPCPQMVLTAMEKCNLKKEDCVFIGDSEVDLLTAKNAELPCISVSWGFRSKETLLNSGATIILDKVEELLNY